MRTPRLTNDAAVPSWASRTESEISQDPKTVLARKPTAMPKRDGNNELDELPVGNAKSFEELLAEQLGCDVEALKEAPVFDRTSKVQQEAATKRTFLRKGSGLARYGGGVTPKALSRSRSQSNVNGSGGTPSAGRRMKGSTSCSKLDIAERETIAFASKKSPPKRSMSIKSVSSTGSASSVVKAPSSFISGKRATTAEQPKSSSKSVEDREVASRLLKGPKKPSQALPSGERAWEHKRKEDSLPVYDSVEWSFMEKLKKADQKHEVIT